MAINFALNTPAWPGPIGITEYHLLSDGRVMGRSNNAQVQILTPDPNGRYATGTWTRIPDAPLNHWTSTATTDRIGRLILHGSEFSTGSGKTSVFDPRTDTWQTYTDSMNVSHLPVVMLNNGAHAVNIENSGGSGVLKVVSASKPNWSAWQSEDTDERSYAIFSENQPVLTGGSFQYLVCFTTRRQSTGNSIADAGDHVYVRNGDGGGSGVLSQIARLTALGGDWRKLATGNGLSWCEVGSSFFYEVGAIGWMQKIGQVVMVGGDGFIYSYDPATNFLDRYDVLPMGSAATSLFPSDGQQFNGYLGTLATNVSGQLNIDNPTIPSTLVVTAPSLAFTAWITTFISNVVSGQSIIHLRTDTNTRALAFTITGASFSGGQFTLTGVTRITGNAWRTGGGGQLRAGAIEVWAARPWWSGADHSGTFLPNGDLLFNVGTPIPDRLTGGFGGQYSWMKWDGISSAATVVRSTRFGSGIWSTIFPLPSGEYFLSDGESADSNIVTLTAPEATPLATMVPVISTFPTSVVAGSTVALTGTNINGQIQGGLHNDELIVNTDFPIGRFRNATTNQVTYATCCRIATRGVFSGANSCTVDVPANLAPGTYDFSIIAGGVPSVERSVAIVTAPTPSGGWEF